MTATLPLYSCQGHSQEQFLGFHCELQWQFGWPIYHILFVSVGVYHQWKRRFRLFIEMGALLAGVAQLGTGYSIWKFFPRFKSDDGHNGAGFWLLLIPLIGFVFVAFLLLWGQPWVVKYLIENSSDFLPYYHWLIPFVFFFVFNTVLRFSSLPWATLFFRRSLGRMWWGSCSGSWVGATTSAQWISTKPCILFLRFTGL